MTSSERGPGRSFEEVDFGDDLPDFQPNVSMDVVQKFTKCTGMMFGRFNDHDEARKSGLPGAIVPGIMSQGILVAMIHAWAPEAEVLSIDTIFRAPLLVDSQPSIRGVVTDRDDDERVVELDLTIVNEAGETRVMGTARVHL